MTNRNQQRDLVRAWPPQPCWPTPHLPAHVPASLPVALRGHLGPTRQMVDVLLLLGACHQTDTKSRAMSGQLSLQAGGRPAPRRPLSHLQVRSLPLGPGPHL